MPSPIGHSLGAYALAQVSRTSAHNRKLLLYGIAIACLPDLDVIPGALIGPPEFYRHGFTHSLVAGLVVSLVAAAYAKATRRRAGFIFVFTLAMYSSHLLLDMLRSSTSPIQGVEIFWPFDFTHYNLALHIFGHTTESALDNVLPIATVIRANAHMIGIEILVLAPIAIIARVARNYRDRTSRR